MPDKWYVGFMKVEFHAWIKKEHENLIDVASNGSRTSEIRFFAPSSGISGYPHRVGFLKTSVIVSKEY